MPVRSVSVAVMLLALGAPAWAEPVSTQDKGCDIQAGSSVRLVPKGAKRSETTTAQSQTPCAVIPNGWENAIGPIGIEIGSGNGAAQDPASQDPALQGTQGGGRGDGPTQGPGRVRGKGRSNGIR